MSYSKRTQSSAYQIYSSAKLDRRHHSLESFEDMHMAHSRHGVGRPSDRGTERYSERSKDVHRSRVGQTMKDSAPRSLLSSSFSSSLTESFPNKKKNMFQSSHRNEDRRKHSSSDKKSSARSLMDIDFSSSQVSAVSKTNSSRWKEPHHAHSSDEDSYEQSDRRSDWKRGRRFSKYSDSEEEEEGDFWHGNVNRNRRSWRDSAAPLMSVSASQHAPLIVDLPDRSNNNIGRKDTSSSHTKPKPLLETYVPPPSKKPVSLLDLPDTSSSNGRRFKRKPKTKSSESSSRRHDNEESRHPSRKRKGSDDEPKLSVKVLKSGNKDRTTVLESHKISVCKSSGHTFLVIPVPCSTVYLHGRARLTVVLGRVKILQYELHKGCAYDVYSPASGSLMAVYAGDGSKIKAEEVKEELSKYNVAENDRDLDNIGNNTAAVLIVDKLESVVCDFVTSFIPYTQLFTAMPTKDVDVSNLRGVTLPKLGLKVAPLKEMVPTCMNMSQDYEDVLHKWTKKLTSSDTQDKKPPILLCCGAKNTGKSTFNRMLINASLNSVSAIAYLECDVGQTEFSPPATLSLHLLKQPVLGPPFCHQRHAEKMVFYGDSSPSQDPSLYIKCLRFIVEAYKDLNPLVPLIVNTMGFPEGIGIMLLIDTMHLVEPDLVVQIESFNQAANMPAITHEFVALEEGWSYNKGPTKDKNPKQKMAETHEHELLLLSTLISQRRDFSFKLKPVDLRNLSLLSALSIGLEKGMTLTSQPPYTVPYRQLGIYVCHHKLSGEDVLTAIDASVVAFCVADISQAERESNDLPLVYKTMPVCSCLGLGFVRGIDKQRGLLYLVTTVPRQYLHKTNTILKGSLSLPDQIILKQKSSEPVPYVDALAPSTAVTSVRPRTRMPRVTLGINK